MALIKMNGVNYWGSSYGQGIIAPMIYSEDEIEVGVWTDSKPLYQKTWKFSSPLSLATNTWVDTPIPNAGMQRIVNGFANDDFDNGGVNQSNAFMYLSFAVNAPTYVRVLNARNATITITHITLQYTKTTDTAGSGIWNGQGGLAHHYSTNETVVGTWVDGKTLYERTVFNNGSAITANAGAWTAICSESWVANVKSIINGNLTRQGTVGDVLVTPAEFTCNNGSIKINPFRNLTYQANGYFTVQYTKTTD